MEKINVAGLLKYCPKGTELYSPLFGNCKFVKVHDYEAQIIVELETGTTVSFQTDGRYYDYPNAECILFPKGKTTWEGFQVPFKNGDIIHTKTHISEWISIFEKFDDDECKCYIDYSVDSDTYYGEVGGKKNTLCEINDIIEQRLATEEEKQKLFNVIKENGHKWNAEIKILVKLVQPKFKVGDVIQDIDAYRVKITEVNLKDECYEYESTFAKGIGSIMFSNQDEWKLVPVIKPKFKVGDNITKIDGSRKGEVFYIDIDRYHVAVSSNIGIDVFFEDQDDWKLIPNKFNITTLKPFESRVLVRDYVDRMWRPAFWGKHIEDSNCRYLTTNGCWMQCIPYEGNEHLLGTTNDCDEYFKNW